MHPVEQLIIDLIGPYQNHRSKLKAANYQKLRQKFHKYIVEEATKRGMTVVQTETTIALIEEEFLAFGIEQMFHYLENKPALIKIENALAKRKGKFKGRYPNIDLPIEV